MWLPVITGGRSVARSRAAREDVADRVDADRAAGLLRPRDEQVACLPVEIGERETAHAALVGRADLREVHQAVPETRTVDAQTGVRRQIVSLHAESLR